MSYNNCGLYSGLGGSGASDLIKVTALNYTALTTDDPATSYLVGDLAIVQEGEEEYFSSSVMFWTSAKYKYPRGFYQVYDNGGTNEWRLYQDFTISSLKALIISPNVDWTAFFNAGASVEIDSIINYSGDFYRNLTGSISVTPPDTDITNWKNFEAVDTSSIVGNYTVLASDNNSLLILNGTFDLNLPTTLFNGFSVRTKNIGTGVITVSSSVNIDDSTSKDIDVQYDSFEFIWDGSQWWIL